MRLGTATALFQVFDMNTSLAFYRTLGFAIVEQSPEIEDCGEHYSHWCWLRCGAADVMLNTAYESIAERPIVLPPDRYLAHHDTCLFIGCDDADALHAEFTAAAIVCAPPIDAPYGMRQLGVTDPDGFLLCFQHAIG